MVQVGGTKRVVHFMAEYGCVEIGGGIGQLQVKIPHPFLMDISARCIQGPAVRPQEVVPIAHITPHHKNNIIHVSVIIIVNVKIFRDLVGHRLHGTCQQLVFTVGLLAIAIPVRVCAAVGFEIAAVVDVLVRQDGIPYWHRIEAGGDGQLVIGGRLEVIVHGGVAHC